MRLTISNMSRSQTWAMLCTTSIISMLTLSGTVSALQNNDAQDDAPILLAADKAAVNTENTANAVAANSSAAGQSDTDTYPASFFEQYSPQNALDMIRRLPGFSFDRGSDARGFGGTAGNVLIDGSRPTSKSGGLEAALQRIPAAQVDYIEIIRGGVSGGEASGQSTVANVIRKQTGSSGTWTFQVRRLKDGSVRPRLEGAISTKAGAWDTSFDIETGGWAGYRTALIRDLSSSGDLKESSDEVLDEQAKFLWASGEGARPFAGGKLTINGRAGFNNWRGDITRDEFQDRLPGASPDGLWELNERNKRREAELGIDWTRTYDSNWRWRLIGLGTVETRYFNYDFAEEDFISDETEMETYDQDRKITEFILRTTYGLTVGKFKPEFGIEGARNQMNNDTVSIDGDGSEIEMVTVREFRGEAFATFNYQLTSALSLDGGVTYEASQIKVSGDNPNEQTVKFLKPRLSATYAFNDDIQLTLEAERRVGQLDFGLFADSSDAADGRDTGGNSKLRPDTRWRAAATLDWQFSERGSLKVKAFRHWRRDILEEIILDDGSFGRGNAGNATFYGIETELTIPTDRFLKGGLLELEFNHRGSNFEDPILGGLSRNISWYTPTWFGAEFRQDLTDAKVSWGVEYNGSFTDIGYQVDQISEFHGNGRFEAFIETTRFWGVKMKLEVKDLNTADFTRTRFIYDDTRAGPLDETEIAARHRHPEFRFEISSTF